MPRIRTQVDGDSLREVLLGVSLLLLSLAAVLPRPASAASVMTGDLPRRAALGFGVDEAEGRLLVARLDPASAAARAGLRDGDVVVAVDGRRFERPYVGEDLVRRLLGGRPATLAVERGGRRLDVAFTPPPRPLEELAGVDTTYGV